MAKRIRISFGATGLALVIAGLLLLGLLTIPAQTRARALTPPAYSYYIALPSTGQGDDLAGVGANAPLARPGSRSAGLPIAGASALLGLGVASVAASFWLRRGARPPA